MQEIFQDYGRRLGRGLALGAAITVVVLCAFACLAIGVALIPETMLNEEAKLYLYLGLFTLLIFAFLAGGVGLALFFRKRTFSGLDQAFTPLGLAPSAYLVSGRQYRGQYRGRAVNIYYHVSGTEYMRTPDLAIYVGGNFRTRLGIGEKNVLTKAGGALLGKTPLETGDPAYQEMVIHPLDETWARSLLAEPAARGAILRLVGREAPGIRALVFGPESVWVQVRHFELNAVTADTARQWLDDLVRLAETAEGLMPPTVTAVASEMERASRSDRSKFTPIALAIAAAIMVCLMVMAAAAVVGGLMLGSQ